MDLFEKGLFGDKAQTGMPFKFLDRSVFKGLLIGVNRRIGRNNVTTLLKFQGPLNASDFNFSADTLCPLAPLQLYRLKLVFLYGVALVR